MFRITRDPLYCFGLNLILKQNPNLSNYNKCAVLTPTTSLSTNTIEPLL